MMTAVEKRFYTGSVIQPDGKLTKCNLSRQDYIGDARVILEGWIEQINIKIKEEPKVMLVDEEGLLKRLPLNRAASSMAGRTIVGPVIVLHEVPKDD